MIRENQKILNRLNVLTDALLVYAMLPLAFWLRFYVLPDGIVAVPLTAYLRLGVIIAPVAVFTYAAFGLYQSFRRNRLRDELGRLFLAAALDAALLLSWLFLGHGVHYSRWVLAIFFVLATGMLAAKRVVVRRALRALRREGRNLRHVLLVGGGGLARAYLAEITADRALGYVAAGYVAEVPAAEIGAAYLGGLEALSAAIERLNPDEVVCALEAEEYRRAPEVIHVCDTAGVRLSIIPYFAGYLPSRPQFDDLNGLPLLNIRRVPLDNFAAAFIKRTVDILGSALLLILTSPLLLFCAIGVRISSPGPILFRQVRVGRNRKNFTMHKFRSMRVNAGASTAWTKKTDSRRTKFGSFIRKYSLDELPQFYDVLIGNMSLVGPRPELPHFVEQFREEIPLYMLRHQARPGITGWAQVNGLRGDTSIQKRIEYDIYYIENWSLWFDIQILLATVFGGKFVNDEQ